MSSLKFGTSGLRGLVGDLEGASTVDYTAAFVASLGGRSPPGSPMLIGRDLRSSSPGIAASVAGAARAAGFRPLDCGALPTPALALEAMRRGWPAIMVTGSHIPDDRNGLKFYTPQGEITKDDETAIGRALRPGALFPVGGEGEPHPDALDLFRARCIAAFAPDALAGLEVGIYQQSSVARDLLVEVIGALGGTPRPFGRASAFIPVDTEAHRPEDVEIIRNAARKQRLDAIVTTDGDGDRPLIADADGRILPGDVVGVLTARHLGIAAVAVPVTAGSAIEASGGFARTVRTRVGSPFVIAGMDLARGEGFAPVAGFEANGGFLLGSSLRAGTGIVAALPTRDSILPLLATLASARAAHAPLADLVARLGFKATASHRLQDVPSDRSTAFLGLLRDSGWRDGFLAPLGRAVAVDDIDGLRIGLEGGDVIHFRASGNAPELRCYAEADEKAAADDIVAWGLAAAATAMRVDG